MEREEIYVDILGTKYEVKYQYLKDEDIDGRCDPTNHEIIVRCDNTNSLSDFEELQKKALRHEIIHAFMFESGLGANWEHVQQFGHDETTVDWFAIQSPKIFKVFKELNIL